MPRWAISVIVLAALGCDDPAPAPCEDAGPYPWELRLAELAIPNLPISSCLADNELRADYPNHIQLTADAVPASLTSTESVATWDPVSNSTWLYLAATVDTPELASVEQPQTYRLKVELDSAALSEGVLELLELDLTQSGKRRGQFSFEDTDLVEVRGSVHSSAVRSLLLQTYTEGPFDYRTVGTLQITRAAGRVRGTVQAVVTGVIPVESSPAPLERVAIVGCFDAPLAQRGVELDSTQCGVNQIDRSGTPDCGNQATIRELDRCGRHGRFLVNDRVDAVTQCVRDKLATGQPFHVRVEIPLSDTEQQVVWIRGPDGVMTRYSSYHRDPGLWMRRCTGPRIAELVDGRQDELIACDALLGKQTQCTSDQIFQGDLQL